MYWVSNDEYVAITYRFFLICPQDYILEYNWCQNVRSCFSRKQVNVRHQTVFAGHVFFQLPCVKSVRVRGYFGLYFPAFGLNTERLSNPTRVAGNPKSSKIKIYNAKRLIMIL